VGPASFGWNDTTTSPETAPSGTPPGNWNASDNATRVSTFPNASGDIAIIQSQTGSAQTINLDQNITVGELLPGRLDAGGASGSITIATGTAGNGASNTLTFNNGASNAVLEQINQQTTNSNVLISVPILIAGNGTLSVSNDTSATVPLTISGNIASGLSSGVQSLVNGASATFGVPSSVIIRGSVKDGTAGGAVAVFVNTSSSNLTLSNTNTYSGGTDVSAGTLTVTSDGGFGSGSVVLSGFGLISVSGGATNNYIADTATLSVGTLATDNLNYTGTDVVGALVLNNMTEPAGIYGSAASGAPNQLPEFTGSGTITVAPEPAMLGAISLGAILLRRRPRRRTRTVAQDEKHSANQ